MADPQNVDDEGRFVNPTLMELHEEVMDQIESLVEDMTDPEDDVLTMVYGYTSNDGLVDLAMVPVPPEAMSNPAYMEKVLARVAEREEWYACTFIAPAYTLTMERPSDGDIDEQVEAVLQEVEDAGGVMNHELGSEAVVVITISTDQFIRSKIGVERSDEAPPTLTGDWDTTDSSDDEVGAIPDDLTLMFQRCLGVRVEPFTEGGWQELTLGDWSSLGEWE